MKFLFIVSETIDHSQALEIIICNSDEKIIEIINENFDLRPGNIVRELALDKPVYLPTAAFGHFGRSEFSWEKTKELKISNAESRVI